MTNMHSSDLFQSRLKTDAWAIPQVADCLQQTAAAQRLDGQAVCRMLLTWLDEVLSAAEHATARRFTRLQFIENTLSVAGFAMTFRDFDAWFREQSGGDWHPDAVLPYAPIDPRVAEQASRVDELEHALHQMEVARNRAKAELAHVQAERDHFLARHTEEIYKSVSADYQNSASWRLTKPLRQLMAWRRGERFTEPKLLPTDITEPTIAPWLLPGYSTEIAWKATEVEAFDRKDYAEWVRRYDNPGTAETAVMIEKVRIMAEQPGAPKFSLLMVVGLQNLVWIKEAVASVEAQLYPHWELCIAAASNTDDETNAYLESVAKSNSKILLAKTDRITVATSAAGIDVPESPLASAYALASGDWIGEINAINIIATKAINTLASTAFKYEKTKIIYSDSDKLLAPKFERCEPDFKPDWNLDLFLSQNYTKDFCFFSADLVKDLGGFDSTSALTQRALEHFEYRDAEQIRHVAKVLVHVRKQAAETEVFEAESQRKIQLYHALHATLPAKLPAKLPATLPLVSLIIPTKNNLTLLRQCIDSVLLKTNYANYEILVIDNGSDQAETLDYLHSLRANPHIRVIRDNYAFNYSALNNYAAGFAKGEILGLINDDIEVKTDNWLTEMVSHALRPGVGAVGARLWYPNQTLQHAGIVMAGGVARHVHKHLPAGQAGFNGRAAVTQNFTAVTGACLVVKKALFEQVGGLNEQELAVGFNDVDLCLKLVEAGYRNVWTPHAELIHHESATRGQDHSPEKQRRAEKELRYMRQRWGEQLYSDPAYNPNLSDGHEDMSFAWPPRPH